MIPQGHEIYIYQCNKQMKEAAFWSMVPTAEMVVTITVGRKKTDITEVEVYFIKKKIILRFFKQSNNCASSLESWTLRQRNLSPTNFIYF